MYRLEFYPMHQKYRLWDHQNDIWLSRSQLKNITVPVHSKTLCFRDKKYLKEKGIKLYEIPA